MDEKDSCAVAAPVYVHSTGAMLVLLVVMHLVWARRTIFCEFVAPVVDSSSGMC